MLSLEWHKPEERYMGNFEEVLRKMRLFVLLKRMWGLLSVGQCKPEKAYTRRSLWKTPAWFFFLMSIAVGVLLLGQEKSPYQMWQLTDHPAPDYSPCWHPGGKKIAFVSEREAGRQIWLVEVGSKRVQRLTKQGNNWSPSFSPDGRLLAFVSDRAGQPQIWVMPAEGEGTARQLTRYHDESPAWSPDGTMIAFVSRRTGEPSLWVMNPNGTMQKLLVRMPGREVRHPTWSPDSRSIIFWANFTGEPSLWEYRLQERALVQLVDTVGNIEKPACSKAGWLAFPAVWTGQWEMWTLPLIGDKPLQLTELRRQVREPAWSPDGRLLAFVTDLSGNWDIWLMEVPAGLGAEAKEKK